MYRTTGLVNPWITTRFFIGIFSNRKQQKNSYASPETFSNPAQMKIERNVFQNEIECVRKNLNRPNVHMQYKNTD